MSTASENHCDAELLDLFDRFLALVGDATRHSCTLFPYNHLCRRFQAMLVGSTARIVVTDDDANALAAFAVTWCDGEFRRVEPRGRAAFVWSVPRQRLEHAAAQPWVYLADPKRLGFVWFDDPGSQSQLAMFAVRPREPVHAAARSSRASGGGRSSGAAVAVPECAREPRLGEARAAARL